MLPKLHRNFTRPSYASWGTYRSTKLQLKQDTTGLLIHQISQRCDLWCGRNRRLFFFSSAIPRGSGNHTLTGSVGDQWHESRDKMVVTLADGPLKYKFINTNVLISIKISLKFVPRGPIYNIPALVQIMAWYRPGDKPLSEPMMVSLLPHICITRPPWVNTCRHIFRCIFLNYVFSSRVSLTCV